MSALSDADPQGIQNLVKDLQSRVAALEQASVHFNALDEAAPDVGGLQFRGVDSNGLVRTIISGYDIFDEFGIHAFLAAFDSSGNPKFYADATTGLVTIVDGAITLTGTGYISIGATPPTSATSGTGIWEDATGIYGLSAGNQQFALDATTGNIIALGGALTINAQGINASGLLTPFNHSSTYSGTTRTGSLGMFLPAGLSAPAYGLSFNAPGSGELTTNGGFESNNFTGWTATGDTYSTWRTQTSFVHDGTYSANLHFQDIGQHGSSGTLNSNRISVSAGNYYFVSLWWMWRGSAGGNNGAVVNWYNAASGGSLISADTIFSNETEPYGVWKNRSKMIMAPAGALSCEIDITLAFSPGGTYLQADYYVDTVSFQQVSISGAIYFTDPGLRVDGMPLHLQEIANPGTLPASGYVGVWSHAGDLLVAQQPSTGYTTELANPAMPANNGNTPLTQEFNTTDLSGVTWTAAPSATDADTTVPGHWYVKESGASIANRYGWFTFHPAHAFSIIAKMSISALTATSGNAQGAGLIVSDGPALNCNRVMVDININPSTGAATIGSYTGPNGSGWTTHGSLQSVCPSQDVWMRIDKDGATNYTCAYSLNGKRWHTIATFSFPSLGDGFIYAAGLRTGNTAATDPAEIIVDFIRGR